MYNRFLNEQTFFKRKIGVIINQHKIDNYRRNKLQITIKNHFFA